MGLYKICEHKGRTRDRCPHAWWGGYRGYRVSLSRWANREVLSKDDAESALAQLRQAVRAGTFDERGLEPPKPKESAPATFAEFAQKYKERHVIAKGLALAKTIDYRLKPLIERFGDMALASIRTADIEDYIADLQKQPGTRRTRGRPLSVASINRQIEFLRHMMNWAVGRDYLDRTPFRRGAERLIRKQHEDNQRRRRLSETEEAKLLNAASPMLRAMIIAALDTGMRRGEMLALRFADIDFDRQIITLRGSTTKSGKTRFVPIPTERLRAVVAWLQLDAAGEQKSVEALMFSDEVGGGIGSFRKAWVTAVLRAHDVEVKWCADGGYRHLAPVCEEAFRKIDLHWHDIRHEYASRLVERGVPLAQVRDLLGHASITTTERYDNQTLENLQASAAKLEAGKVFAPAPTKAGPPAPPKPDGEVVQANPPAQPPRDLARRPRGARDATRHQPTPPPTARLDRDATTFCQVFVKIDPDKAGSASTERALEKELSALRKKGLQVWLGGRDLNPDNVVQSHVSYR
jgi:integrase